MNDQELDRLFERFRRRGDVLALGAIFDATAPELLRVAMSLVREPGEADDLLQETFLTAIERSERYEAGRRLVPWLLGILVLHAKERRAQRRRELDPARLMPRETLAPETHALGSELEQELERALAGLSARERVVLEAYLRLGKGAAEIASEMGAAPGAVRMQIHRGLDHLRRLLPAGLALGAAGASNAQGLGAVRSRVLREGETAAKNLVPGAGSAAGAGLAGVLMGKKLVLAGVVAAVAGVWFLAERVARTSGGDPVQVARAGSPARPRAETELVHATREEPRSGASVVESSITGPSRAPLTAAADPGLAGLRGRVVEHDGRPVPGVSVALIEVEETLIYPTLFASVDAPSPPRLVVASAVTGADGVFELDGARARALHGLGVDLGGARAALRMLDALLSPGDTTELGDVVLDATGALAGRVVDEDGQPVAGARVRVGGFPELALGLGLQYVVPGGALTEFPKKGDRPYFVFELPDWTAELEAMLPLATTTTDADGRFALARASAGRLTALVDAPGFARLAVPPVDLVAGEQHDLGELVLESGANVPGRVLDERGLPVANAELRAGTIGLGGMAVFGPIRTCDGEGRFEVVHLPRALDPAVIVRRDALSPWLCAREEGGEFAVKLGAESELEAEVVDAAGTAVAAPQFFLRPGHEVQELGVFAPPLRPLEGRAIDGEPGHFRLGPLALGTVLVTARAAGLAEATASVDLGTGAPPVLHLRLAPLQRTGVVVRDAETGEGIAGALVRVLEGPTQPIASARTDGDGRAWLDLPDDPAREPWLAVEHPLYAPRGLALAPSSATRANPVEVELSGGARLVARLDDPVLASQRCMLQLWYEGGTSPHEFHLPRFCAVPREGALELEHLATGDWSWRLLESVAGGDVLGFLTPERIPHSLAGGKLVLAEGQTFELALSGDLAPASAAPGASLSGVVRVEGRLAGDLEVNLSPLVEGSEAEPLYTDGHGGRFRIDGIPPGRYFLSVSAPALTDQGKERELVQETLEFTGTEERELEFDVASIPAHVSVLTADGQPARDVELRFVLMEKGSFTNVETTTDEDGSARPVLPRAGRYAVFATQRDEGAARAELEVAAGAANELELRLSRGVECAGRLRLEPGATFREESGELLVSPEDDSWLGAKCPVELVNGAATFRVVGLSPGKYKVLLWGGDDLLHTTFELPEWGDPNLELRFTGRGGR